MTYAIIRYRLLAITLILKKASIIAFFSITVIVVVYFVPLYFQPLLYKLWGDNWIFLPMSLAFFVGIILLQAMRFLRRVDEAEFSKRFSYRPILKKEAERTAKAKNLNELLSFLVRDLSCWIRLDYVGVLVWDEYDKKFVLTKSVIRTKNRNDIPKSFSFNLDDPLIAEILKQKKPLICSELEYHFQMQAKDFSEMQTILKIIDQMKQLGAEIIVPCFCEGRLLALISLGRKLNINDSISNQDLDLFVSLSNNISRTIYGFILKDEKVKLIVASQNVLIGAIEAKDRYTRGHTDRVAYISCLIGKKLERQLRAYTNGVSNLNWAAQLHDVGKIGIPDKILLKEGPLDDEEYEIIKKHPDNGLRIVAPVEEWLGEDICAGIFQHHENYDGSGYPNQQKGDQIHLFAQIIRVADAFDAMVTDRPYRRGLSYGEAILEIRKYKGVHFAPYIVDVMDELYDIWENKIQQDQAGN